MIPSIDTSLTCCLLSSGPWIVIPAYMVWSQGGNILDGLVQASGSS